MGVVDVCDTCGDCFEACPVDAIKEVGGQEKSHYTIDEEECIDCGECVEVCPRDAVFSHKDFGSPVICDFCGVSSGSSGY